MYSMYSWNISDHLPHWLLSLSSFYNTIQQIHHTLVFTHRALVLIRPPISESVCTGEPDGRRPSDLLSLHCGQRTGGRLASAAARSELMRRRSLHRLAVPLVAVVHEYTCVFHHLHGGEMDRGVEVHEIRRWLENTARIGGKEHFASIKC